MRLFALGLAVIFNWQAVAKATSYHTEIQRQVRIEHARELLGKYYRHSVVRRGERVARINAQVYQWTKEHMPAPYRAEYRKVAKAIVDEAIRYEFDPVFLMSVIENESSFNPDMRGALDEIGLMQLRPATADWIAAKFKLKYSGAQALFNPVVNIRIGAAYLAYLREKFDSHAQLYLAAYNMGARNVASALDQSVWPKDYPSHVMRYYVEFYSELEIPAHKKADHG